MDVTQENKDVYSDKELNELNIKQEPECINLSSTIKLELNDGDAIDQSISHLNPLNNIKLEESDCNEVISEVKVSEFFVNTNDIIKIKQEIDEEVNKSIKSEFLNEECDLKSEKDEDIEEQACGSQETREHYKKSKQIRKRTKSRANACPICRKNFATRASRLTHLDLHFRKGPVPCRVCETVFTNKHSLIEHSALHKDEIEENAGSSDESKEHKCDICSRVLKTRKTLLAHIKNHSEQTPKCKVCSAEFKNKLELKLHMLLHKGRTPLKCNICSKEFLCKSFLDIHYRFHSGEKPFQCEICSKQFLVRSLLDHHMFVHKGVKPFKCDICSKEFTHKPSFDQHVKKHNRPDFFSVEIKTECDNGLVVYETQQIPFVEPRPYECEYCSKTYRRKQELKKHMRNHTGERPYECEICLKRFTLKPVLQNHMIVHSGEKRYTCDICFNKFSQKKNLTDHYRSHTGEKPFKCDFCPKDFFHRKNLKEHILKHTGERPFKCELCSAEFAASRYLKRHEKIHAQGEQIVENS